MKSKDIVYDFLESFLVNSTDKEKISFIKDLIWTLDRASSLKLIQKSLSEAIDYEFSRVYYENRN